MTLAKRIRVREWIKNEEPAIRIPSDGQDAPLPRVHKTCSMVDDMGEVVSLEHDPDDRWRVVLLVVLVE